MINPDIKNDIAALVPSAKLGDEIAKAEIAELFAIRHDDDEKSADLFALRHDEETEDDFLPIPSVAPSIEDEENADW